LHPSIEAEHVDRVIGDAFDKPPKLLVASAEHRLGGFAFAKITRDFGISDKIARSVADRIDDDTRPKPGAILANPPALALKFTLIGRREDPCR
jgi:hypothetical protein